MFPHARSLETDADVIGSRYVNIEHLRTLSNTHGNFPMRPKKKFIDFRKKKLLSTQSDNFSNNFGRSKLCVRQPQNMSSSAIYVLDVKGKVSAAVYCCEYVGTQMADLVSNVNHRPCSHHYTRIQ